MRNGYCEAVRLGSWTVDVQWAMSLGGQAFVIGFMAIHDDRRTSVCRQHPDGVCSVTGDCDGLGWTSTGMLKGLLVELLAWERKTLKRAASCAIDFARLPGAADDCTNGDALEADFNDEIRPEPDFDEAHDRAAEDSIP